MGLSVGTALAHEGREVEGYRFVVGWLDEPAYEGFKNAVELRVTEATAMSGADDAPHDSNGNGHHADGNDRDSDHSMPMAGPTPVQQGAMAMGHRETVPVEGLEGNLQVEVTHVSTGTARVVSLYPTRNDPGHYTAALLPTAPGVYQFRVFGDIHGAPVNESFLSRGGGGGFDDINSSADLHFPDRLPEIRELQSAVRGAISTAENAQDAALAAASVDANNGSNILSVLSLVLGALGSVSGVGGLTVALRRRR